MKAAAETAEAYRARCAEAGLDATDGMLLMDLARLAANNAHQSIKLVADRAPRHLQMSILCSAAHVLQMSVLTILRQEGDETSREALRQQIANIAEFAREGGAP